jgi:hypothetical protein
VFRIELTRGSRWEEPLETVDRRECETESIAAAVAEAKHWLMQTQKNTPARGVTHYRVVGQSGAAIGGPP